jgi:nucleotide-binding universal stress UspA family protein
MKILICSDGSEQAERAIRLGAGIAVACQAEVTLFGIIETPSRSDAILESLKRGQALLAEKKIPAELTTRTGDPITEIVQRTEQQAYDLVVIGAVRKETQGLFWMSSKSYKIIKETRPPVLSVAGQVATIKRMLICSAGGRYIDSSLPLMAQIAHGMQAAVTLLHVMPEPPAIYAGLSRLEETADVLLASRSELGLSLSRQQQTFTQLGVKAEVRLRHGPVLEQILRELKTGDYDVVVTGSAPSRSLRTYVLGDISREIVNQANCAVLVVRGQTARGGTGKRLQSWFRRSRAAP